MRLFLSILLVLLIVPGWTGTERLPLLDPHAPVSIAPVLLDPSDPARVEDGALLYVGGWQLSSPDPAFGGFSSMSVEGHRFTLLNDGGNYLRFDMAVPGRITNVVLDALPAGPGRGWRKEDRDSESMTLDPATGTRWVGFEHHNAVWRYGRDFKGPAKGVEPLAMRHWPVGGGPESLVRLRDGKFLMLGETARWPGPMNAGRAAILFNGDPVENPRAGFRFAYRPPDGFVATDAVELPDGRLLVLNRHFQLPYVMSARITLVDRKTIRPGVIVSGRSIASLEPPLIHDNFEGLAVTREGTDTILWVVSDDNQTRLLQRTLLLKFRLR